MGLDFEMVLVEAAGESFMMGVRRVRFAHDYKIGKYLVTQEQWETVMGFNPAKFKGTQNPIETISWEEAMAFCDKINAMPEVKRPEGWEYILPTEAQWEFAARGGKKKRACKFSGSDDLDAVAWFKDNSGKTTHPVGLKAPNELGIYDMTGNVCEWCLDACLTWDEEEDEKKNPPVPSFYVDGDTPSVAGSNRVVRGGSWYGSERCCPVQHRCEDWPDSQNSNLGFRLALVQVK